MVLILTPNICNDYPIQKSKIKTIKAEINTRNFLSKFGKQKSTGINK